MNNEIAIDCRPSRSGPLTCCEGQAIIETALVLPLVLILMLNIMNFSLFIYGWITINNAARVAAEYQVYNGVVVGSSGLSPSAASVATAVANDTGSLPGSLTVSVQVCSSFNGTSSCNCSPCTYTPAADPEPATYRSWSIDVSYTYQPVVASFNLISARTIHQQVVMRSMQ
jgi:Flp pilus assembly protein TadG